MEMEIKYEMTYMKQTIKMRNENIIKHVKKKTK